MSKGSKSTLSYAEGIISGLELVVCEDIVVYFGNGSESNSHIAVGAAVIYGDASGSCVCQCSAWEAYTWYEAAFLVILFWCKEIVLAAVKHTGRLIDIEYSSAYAVYVAVTGVNNSVVEQQPALIGLDRSCTTAYFQAFPPVIGASHDMAVASPELHVGAF